MMIEQIPSMWSPIETTGMFEKSVRSFENASAGTYSVMAGVKMMTPSAFINCLEGNRLTSELSALLTCSCWMQIRFRPSSIVRFFILRYMES